MPAAEKIAVLFNPAANKGRTAAFQADLGMLMRAAGLRPELFPTAQVGDAQRWARELAEAGAHSAVIAAGGDGTINEVINGLVGSDMPMGLLPLGTGNDFVKMFDIDSLETAIQLIAHGTHRTIDVGFVNGRAFLNGVGVGLDARIAIEAHNIKRLKGLSVYIAALLKTLRTFEPPELILHLNGKTLRGRWSLVTVGNGGCHGGGFWLTPDAEVDDGRFDVCTAKAMPTFEMLQSFPKVLKGAHFSHPEIDLLYTTEIVIEAPQGAPVHVDGEILGASVKRLEIILQPNALKLRI